MELAIPLGRVIVRLGYHTNKVLRMVLAWRNCSINITYHVVEDSKYPQGVKKKCHWCYLSMEFLQSFLSDAHAGVYGK